jgi:hypothetical protein
MLGDILAARGEGLYLKYLQKLTKVDLLIPDGHLKIPHLWPGQNPPPQGRQNGS